MYDLKLKLETENRTKQENTQAQNKKKLVPGTYVARCLESFGLPQVAGSTVGPTGSREGHEYAQEKQKPYKNENNTETKYQNKVTLTV